MESTGVSIAAPSLELEELLPLEPASPLIESAIDFCDAHASAIAMNKRNAINCILWQIFFLSIWSM